MPRQSAPMLGAFILFGVDKIVLTLALGAAKLIGLVDLSWWLLTAPVWAAWPLLWPLGRLTEELLSLVRPLAGRARPLLTDR